MEVIAFHFVPPEPMQRKPNGSLESVSNAAARRVFRAQAGQDTLPQVHEFTQKGGYPLILTPEHCDEALLTIEEKRAAVSMKKTRRRRSHRLLDINGNLLSHKRVAVLTNAKEKQLRGIGIVKPHKTSYSLEWYVYSFDNALNGNIP